MLLSTRAISDSPSAFVRRPDWQRFHGDVTRDRVGRSLSVNLILPALLHNRAMGQLAATD